jgi:hypothetical protein
MLKLSIHQQVIARHSGESLPNPPAPALKNFNVIAARFLLNRR